MEADNAPGGKSIMKYIPSETRLVSCLSSAARDKHFSYEQIFVEIEGIPEERLFAMNAVSSFFFQSEETC